ncbi:MAG: synthase gamma subunit [Frankiales bacterium]|jgi:F-type H+-transporting ATPase subunit gamma|nr:synthase gamma subunit [Frankiales bacterium]
MGAQVRVYRRRIKSVQSTKKITRAMELIAASRIVKAQAAVNAAQPYARQITRVISALASQSTIEHPLLQEKPSGGRAAVLVVSSDRGLAGGYNANALKTAASLEALLKTEGKEPVVYLVGRKAVGYYRFRGRDVEQSWTGFSEQPKYSDAKEVADALIAAFLAPFGEGGVDELHVVHTEYVSALTQRPVANRILPLVVEESDAPPPEGALPLYEFEPSPEALLDALLPRYVQTRVYAALLESAASESASRRRAMKAATDNADELIKSLTRAANSARQADITQEISEIVGGAAALSG